jgi:hypothetical protein
VLLCLFAAGIAPDLLDRAIVWDTGTLQWYFYGALIISLVLPSAVVAWQEPNQPAEA